MIYKNKNRCLSLLLIPLFFAALIIFQGCISTEYNVATRQQEIFLYSSEREAALGANIARKVREEYDISEYPAYIIRLRDIGRQVASVSDRKELSYYFYIIDEDEKNAFSLPGGYIFIYKGLMDLLDCDDELAFVLAHEIGHVVPRHHIKKMQAALGANLLMLGSAYADSPGFSRGVSFALAQVFTAYSREDEFMADELAVKYTKMTGFNPEAGVRVLEKLYDIQKEQIRPLSYFRTHPYTAQRIRHIKKTLGLALDVVDFINIP